MYFKDPELRFNIDDPYSPHSIILHLVKNNKTILDVGCNTGYIGEYFIKSKNCICDGIDCNREYLSKAKRKGYRYIYLIDLYQTHFSIKNSYDTILFIDILEHLPNPFEILRRITEENLKEDGEVIICLPNIARLEFRIAHLLGNFNYGKSGIMSQDHLRFYTQKSATEMIRKSGLKVKQIIPTGLGARIKILPTLLAFQFILIGSK